MKLLAVDTSTVACSVALLLDDIVIDRHEEQEREHTRLVVPMIEDVLREGQCTLSALDALVLGIGPGSFIGLRIATSLVQGLAFGAGLRVAPVSSMLAVAEEVFTRHEADRVFVAQGAHMNEVYLGQFACDQAVQPVGDERLQAQDRLPELAAATDETCFAAGAGWERYPDLWSANESGFSGLAAVRYPSARFLLPTAQCLLEAGALLDPADIEPAYLRHEVAMPPRQS